MWIPPVLLRRIMQEVRDMKKPVWCLVPRLIRFIAILVLSRSVQPMVPKNVIVIDTSTFAVLDDAPSQWLYAAR